MKIKLFITFIALCMPLSVFSYDIVIDGVYYNLNKNTKEASVTGSSPIITYIGEENHISTDYVGDVVIPSFLNCNGVEYTVTSIAGNYSTGGYGSELTYYRGAFEDCNMLTSITIPPTIKSIGTNAFGGCNSLKAVYISDLSAWCKINFEYYSGPEASYFGFDITTNPLFYAHDLYLNGSIITDLIIPDDISRINRGQFVGGSFKSITFHENFNGVGYKSFFNCNNLKEVFCYSRNVDIIEDVVNLGSVNVYSVFSDYDNVVLHIYHTLKFVRPWSKFKNIVYFDYTLSYIIDDVVYKEVYYEKGASITPEAEPAKDGYIFSGWEGLVETMPDHDVTVTGTFSPNTYKLTYKIDEEEYNVVEVKCNEAITAEPDPIKKGMTFSGWKGLPETMPAKDVEVTGSFSWSKVTEGNIIYQVTDTINNYCSVIGSDITSGGVVIPLSVDFDDTYKVTTITDKIFYGKSKITKIEIPATVTIIGERAFANIEKLNDVYVYATEIPETDRTAFQNSYIEDYVTLHVPEGSLEKYKATAPWKNFKEVVGIAAPQEPSKCAAPTIIIVGDNLTFGCETEGVTYHYNVSCSYEKSGEGGSVELQTVYKVSVYASKDGFVNSETVAKDIKLDNAAKGSGDSNGDGVVNAADIVTIVNTIMQGGQ